MQESHIDYRFFFEVPSTRRCSTQRHIQGKHPNRCDDDHGSGDDDGDDDDDGGDGDDDDDDDDDDPAGHRCNSQPDHQSRKMTGGCTLRDGPPGD